MADDPGQVAQDLRLVIGRIARRLRQSHAVGELALSEVSVLSRLHRDGPIFPGTLAERERVRPQAMATTVATLEERGLVRRQQDSADGRRVLLTLTASGRSMLLDRRAESTRRITEVIGESFTAAERRRLLAVLPLLDKLADKL